MSRVGSVVRRIIGYGLVCCALGLIGCGIAMFWGPLHQVLAAPFVILLGAATYLTARMLQYFHRQDEERRRA